MKNQTTTAKKTPAAANDGTEQANDNHNENGCMRLDDARLEVSNFMDHAENQNQSNGFFAEEQGDASTSSTQHRKKMKNPSSKATKKKKKKGPKEQSLKQATLPTTSSMASSASSSGLSSSNNEKIKKKRRANGKKTKLQGDATPTTAPPPPTLEMLRLETLAYMDRIDQQQEQDNIDHSTTITDSSIYKNPEEEKSLFTTTTTAGSKVTTTTCTSTSKSEPTKKTAKKKTSKKDKVGDNTKKKKQKSNKTRTSQSNDEKSPQKSEEFSASNLASPMPSLADTCINQLLERNGEVQIAENHPPPLTRDGRFLVPGSFAVAGPGASVSEGNDLFSNDAAGDEEQALNGINSEEVDRLPVALPAELVTGAPEVPMVAAIATRSEHDEPKRNCLGNYSRRVTVLIVMIVVIVLLAVSLGVGIGVGLSSPSADGSEQSSTPDSAEISPSSQAPALGGLASTALPTMSPSRSPTTFPSPAPSISAPTGEPTFRAKSCQTYDQDLYDIGITASFTEWTPAQIAGLERVYADLLELYDTNPQNGVTAKVTLNSHSRVDWLPGALDITFTLVFLTNDSPLTLQGYHLNFQSWMGRLQNQQVVLDRLVDAGVIPPTAFGRGMGEPIADAGRCDE